MGNLFAPLPDARGGERFDVLLQSGGVRIERIVSGGHASPEGFWYDQSETEWVVLLRGSAVLEFEGGGRTELAAGDHLTLAPHVRHRVARTSADALWLAVHAEPGR